MPSRNFNAGTYKYGFNGKENDKETFGTGEGTQDYGMRIYNPALGKFLSIDPLSPQYSFYTPYQFAGNTPIQAIDLDGLEEIHFTYVFDHITGKTQLIKGDVIMDKTFLGIHFRPNLQVIITFVEKFNSEANKEPHYEYSEYRFSDGGWNSFDDLTDFIKDPSSAISQEDLHNTNVRVGCSLIEGSMYSSAIFKNSMKVIPQGFTKDSYGKFAKTLKEGIPDELGNNVRIQGSRASKTAGPDSDIDIAVVVDDATFDAAIIKAFGKPNVGSAKEKTMLHAIKTGKIQAGEAGLSGLRKKLEGMVKFNVDISIIKKNGAFDNGAQIIVPSQNK